MRDKFISPAAQGQIIYNNEYVMHMRVTIWFEYTFYVLLCMARTVSREHVRCMYIVYIHSLPIDLMKKVLWTFLWMIGQTSKG